MLNSGKGISFACFSHLNNVNVLGRIGKSAEIYYFCSSFILHKIDMQGKENITKEIMGRIAQSAPGTIFLIRDFADLNNSIQVGKVLTQSEKLNKLIRLSVGIYFKPEYSRFGLVYPSVETIVETIAERDKIKLLPTGSTAMNILGLSTQVPMNAVYITDGSSRVINVGKRKITFRRSVPKNFAYKGKLMSLLVQALKSIGKENVTSQDIQIIRGLLQEHQEESTIQEDLSLAPAWMNKILSPIIYTKQHE